jgi:hypothetical protein
MKIEITEKGVHDAKGKPIAVGTIIEVKGEAMPAWLLNKAVEVKGGKASKQIVVNPDADMADLLKQAAELGIEVNKDAPMSLQMEEELRAAINTKLAA